MRIALIVAVAENGVIGRGGGMPWHIPSDLKTFRRLTLGKPVIMGRKTFASLGKPLPGRDNIVVTRDRGFSADGVEVAADLAAALALAQASATRLQTDEAMVIGGAEIYRLALPKAARIYLTRVHAQPTGDTYFPALSMVEWRLASSQPIRTTEKDEFPCTLLVYDRISSGLECVAP